MGKGLRARRGFVLKVKRKASSSGRSTAGQSPLAEDRAPTVVDSLNRR